MKRGRLEGGRGKGKGKAGRGWRKGEGEKSIPSIVSNDTAMVRVWSGAFYMIECQGSFVEAGYVILRYELFALFVENHGEHLNANKSYSS